jgi:hypothetical protein
MLHGCEKLKSCIIIIIVCLFVAVVVVKNIRGMHMGCAGCAQTHHKVSKTAKIWYFVSYFLSLYF